MQELTSAFNFVKSLNGKEAAIAATGDSAEISMMILMVLICSIVIISILSKKHVVGNHVCSRNDFLISSNASYIKFTVAAVSLLFSVVLGLFLFNSNNILAHAKNTQPLNVSDAKVSVLDNGIEKVEPAILTNQSDNPVEIRNLKLCLIEQAASNSTGTIKREGVLLFNGAPEETSKVVFEPFRLEPRETTVLDIQIVMDAQIAISLIDKTPVMLNLSFVELYNVKFDVQGRGVTPDEIVDVVGGEKINPPEEPSAELGHFGGGFKEPNCTNEGDFDRDAVNSNLILYAKGTPIGPIATIDLKEGLVKSEEGVPNLGEKIGDKKYQKPFISEIDYTDILKEGDNKVAHSEMVDDPYINVHGLPDTGKLTNDKTFKAEYLTNYNYQVCIGGVKEDVSDSKGTLVNLTFGPATGEESDASCMNKHCESIKPGKRCLAEDTGDEIVQHAGDVDGNNESVYSECLKNGCTKSVPLNLNSTIGKMPDQEEFVSILHKTNGPLYEDYIKGNFQYDSEFKDFNSTNGATSRIRATLNGHKGGTPSLYAGDKCLDSSNCLLSCFPSTLQKSIKTKFYTVPSKGSMDSPFTIDSEFDLQVQDKLWLLSAEEVYGNVIEGKIPYKEYGIKQYSKKYNEETNGINSEKNLAFIGNDGGSAEYGGLRTPYKATCINASCVYGGGICNDVGAAGSEPVDYDGIGISPCFCL